MERTLLARGAEEEYETGYGGAAVAEALDVRAGDRYIDTTRSAPDLLSGHGGTGEHLYLGWTAVPDTAAAIDVVVHLHGYSADAPTRSMLENRVAASGLDLSGRTRPTLAILPRGRKITDGEVKAARQAGQKVNPRRYSFPALLAQEGRGLEALIQYALAFFSREALGGRTIAQGRLIITAHSGGGEPLNDLLTHHGRRAACNPHEVHIFDALYFPVNGIAGWVRSRVARDTALGGGEALARDGGGCRVLYGAGTEAGSIQLAQAFPAAAELRAAYRAERTAVEHGDIPRVFGRALLTSIRADLVLVPSRGHAVAPLEWDEAAALAADEDARSWPAADETTRASLASSVRGWVLSTDRSAIELLGDAARRRHFLEDVSWQQQDFHGRGQRTGESEALFNELQRVVAERRVPGSIRYHNVDAVVTAVPGNGGVKLFPEAKDAFVRMREAAATDGVSLTIQSAWRSAATQDRIKSGNPNPAAVAQGVSSHTYGLAIDLALTVPGLKVTEISTASMPNMVAMYRSPVYKWMALNGRRFGWFPYRREPWHWEYNPDGFKARYEAGARTGAALAYGAPIGLLEAYAPGSLSESFDAPKAKPTTAPAKDTCAIPPKSKTDPSALVVSKVGTKDYTAGTMTTSSGETLNVRGVVFYPASADGDSKPFDEKAGKKVPVVFIAHGNHNTVYDEKDRKKEGAIVPPTAPIPSGWKAVPSYRGYEYWQRQLARMGIASVSVDCNQTNGPGGGARNISDRAELIAASIKHFQSLTDDKEKVGKDERYKDKIFGGHLEFKNVGLMGHSRGGEAALLVPILSTTRAVSGVTFKAVLSLAPTYAGAVTGDPKGFAFMTILPAGDGDVAENDGAIFYDRAVPPSFKSQLYVHEANHNFFNVEWSYVPDRKCGSRMLEADHRQILSVYGCAFFRTALLGHSLEKIVTGREIPAGARTDNVHVSAEVGGVVTVEDHQDSTPTKNTMLQTITKVGYATADEHPFSQAAKRFNGSFFGNTQGVVVQRSSAKNQFTSPLAKPMDLTGKEVWIRCAEVYTGSVPKDATGFKIGLVDEKDAIAFVDSDAAGGLPRPFDRKSDDETFFSALKPADKPGYKPDYTKTMLKTFRFPVSCFTAKSKLKTKAIVLQLDRADNRALAFDQWQIV